MLKEKLTFKRKKAVLLTVKFNGTVEEYAMAWLKLTNNAREYSNMIWKIKNTPGNIVYVYCNPKSIEAVRDFCTGIVSFYHEDENKIHSVGEIVDETEITVGFPIYECQSTCRTDDPQWDKDYDNAINDWMEVEE